MEKDRGATNMASAGLLPEEVEIARNLFGDRPAGELKDLLFAEYEKYDKATFGSTEAAEAYGEKMRRVEAEMIQELDALERRVKGL